MKHGYTLVCINRKKGLSLVLASTLALSLFTGCSSSSSETSTNADGNMTLNVSGLSAGMQTFPAYLADKNGWFEEEGLDIELIYFDNGPVQMESMASGIWDVGCTGIGGVLSGVVAYGGEVIAASNSDDGTQMIFVRADSAIANAGQGNNTLDPSIYGDAASWDGAQVLCSAGTVLQYLLIKVIGGFGLTIDDIEFVAMDTPTTNVSFEQGQGDAAVLTGVTSLDAMSAGLVMVSSGVEASAGLQSNVVAAPDAVETKGEEIQAFLKGYFRALDWIEANKEDAVDEFVTFCETSGSSTTEDVARQFIEYTDYYSIEDNYNMFNTIADGTDMCIMENDAMSVLNFFIESGSYMEGDDELYKGQTNADFITAIYEG